MSPLSGLYAPGVVSAVRRRVGLHLETLIVCDAAHSVGASAASRRGFYKLVGAQLGPALSVYELKSNSGALRPYVFSSFLACAAFCADTGVIFFSEGHDIRWLDSNNVVGRLVCDFKFCYPSSIALSEADSLCVTDSHGLHVLRLEAVADGFVATAVSSRSHDEDWRGQVGFASGSGLQVMFSATAVYKFGRSHGWHLWAGNEALSGLSDGAGQAARFTSITAVGIDGNGATVVLDAQLDGRTVVRRIDEEGFVETLHSPSPLDETDFDDEFTRGGLLSCDSEVPMASGPPVDCSPPPGAFALEPFESAFRGGGLRCPLVLDDLLVLCAPLRDALLFLHMPGLREFPCHSGPSSPARSCASASEPPVITTSHCGDACCGGSSGLARSQYGMLPCDDTSSCASSNGTSAARYGSRHGSWPRRVLRDGACRKLAALGYGSSHSPQDEDEVSSKIWFSHIEKRRAPAGSPWEGSRAGKRSRKRFQR